MKHLKEFFKVLSLLFTSCCYTDDELQEMGVKVN